MKNVGYLQEWKSVHKCVIDVEYELPEDYDIDFIRIYMREELLSDTLHSTLYIDTTALDIVRVIEVSYQHDGPYVAYEVSATTLLFLLLSYKSLELLTHPCLDYLSKRVKNHIKEGHII